MSEESPEAGDTLDALAQRLPFSPLTALGASLGILILLRSWADPAGPRRDLIVSVLPLVTCGGVVAADRWLIADGVDLRDRLTVVTYALGGFLTAWIITGIQVPLLVEDAGPVADRLFLMLVGGTVGVAAGTVAGTAEVRQRQAARAARRERERLESFASVVSHDLRNPLEVARGYLQNAFETGDPDHLIRVKEALERMDELIEDSLSLARKGTVVEDSQPVDLASVANDAWDVVDTGDAALSCPDPGVVEADEPRLRELLENLFRNAVEHGSTSPDSQTRHDAVEHGSTSPPSRAREDAAGTSSGEPSVADAPEDAVGHGRPADDEVAADAAATGATAGPGQTATTTADGGPSLTITVGATDDGFYVADDGVGIPPDERDAVFDRGHTTDPDGSGLGLAIVETIAEAHDWTVSVGESDAGGARFEFET